MIPMSIQAGMSATINPLPVPTRNVLRYTPLKTPICLRPKPSSLYWHSLALRELIPSRKGENNLRVSASVAAIDEEEGGTSPADDSTIPTTPSKEKLGVVVKPMEKPRLVSKFIWMEKNIGIGLDQSIPGHGTIPLSPYYFWPRKDAWEELKVLLESKPWISQKQMILLLNQATDIINLWQASGGNLSPNVVVALCSLANGFCLCLMR
ncbi:30S ribosomal protein 3, chloroplastic-like [Tripterygium wilfordii]|uniref:30S ribosomal protein 3, chloroplastic-like n=1 Tax=Tripterygium wilfordii TaxID=458696 RepID=UPI0018F821D0|nr:30S ribosomal protein 3, chloroplastic-like [Tripterygium wilfordii]XP_038720137.1 30S ribosomal protein 3, chloroplastic-like [Tripterygium wilfordii]